MTRLQESRSVREFGDSLLISTRQLFANGSRHTYSRPLTAYQGMRMATMRAWWPKANRMLPVVWPITADAQVCRRIGNSIYGVEPKSWHPKKPRFDP